MSDIQLYIDYIAIANTNLYWMCQCQHNAKIIAA